MGGCDIQGERFLVDDYISERLLKPLEIVRCKELLK
jgi:hypothetical protein